MRSTALVYTAVGVLARDIKLVRDSITAAENGGNDYVLRELVGDPRAVGEQTRGAREWSMVRISLTGTPIVIEISATETTAGAYGSISLAGYHGDSRDFDELTVNTVPKTVIGWLMHRLQHNKSVSLIGEDTPDMHHTYACVESGRTSGTEPPMTALLRVAVKTDLDSVLCRFFDTTNFSTRGRPQFMGTCIKCACETAYAVLGSMNNHARSAVASRKKLSELAKLMWGEPSAMPDDALGDTAEWVRMLTVVLEDETPVRTSDPTREPFLVYLVRYIRRVQELRKDTR